jgi:hypothetical protein
MCQQNFCKLLYTSVQKLQPGHVSVCVLVWQALPALRVYVCEGGWGWKQTEGLWVRGVML